MQTISLFACAATLSLAAGQASAQTTAEAAKEIAGAQTAPPPKPWVLPDPATIQVPDLANAVPEFDSSGEPKYFFFHKPGVSFETAAADLRECFAYSMVPKYPTRMPGFVAFVEMPPTPPIYAAKKPVPVASNYGLVGTAIGAILMPSLLRRQHQSTMRMCMGFKMYRRYPTSKDIYIALNEGDPTAAILTQARIASGPAPTIANVAP